MQGICKHNIHKTYTEQNITCVDHRKIKTETIIVLKKDSNSIEGFFPVIIIEEYFAYIYT